MDCMDTYQGVTDDVLQQIRRLELDTDKNSDKHKNVKAAQDIIDRIYCRDLYTLIGEKRVKWDTETIKVLVNLPNVIFLQLKNELIIISPLVRYLISL